MKLYLILFLSAIAMADDTNLKDILHEANNKFTSNMFSEVARVNRGKSVILSAFSVMTPLAQLALASEGPSHDELLNSIGLPNDNVTKLVFSESDKKLKSVQGVELKTASKVYIPLNYELHPEFADISKNVFHSEVANVDFLKGDMTALEINKWVEEQTNHKIKNLVDSSSLTPDTRAILVNALYFKGSWVNPFEKHLTQERDFHVSKDTSVKVPMMHKKADFKYVESETLNSKILEMPYEGRTTSMVIVLPNEVDGLDNVLEKLKDLSVLDNESKQMYEVEVDVAIPKFKIETTTDLKSILQKMNVKKMFDSTEARLNKLVKNADGLYVTSALQKAFIEVNEEGAEAAAANAFGAETTSIKVNFIEYRFWADHPFVFFLREDNNILFCGTYNS